MKKILTIFIIGLFALIPTINVDAKNEKVTLNVFYAEWCSNCTNLHAYLDELEKDKNYNDMFKIKYYRIDDQEKYGENKDYKENLDLFFKVATYLKYNGSSIPFYVVGEDYNLGFSPVDTPNTIKNMIKNAYFDKNYKDVVSKIKSGEIDVQPTTTKANNNNNNNNSKEPEEDEAQLEKNSREVTAKIGVVVIVITIVAVIVCIIINRRKR